MLRPRGLAFIMMLSACEEHLEPRVPPAPRERLEGFVVVAPGAHLRLRASETAAYVVTARGDDVARLRKLYIGSKVFRVVADAGDFVEVETTGEEDRGRVHCEPMLDALESLSVRFFVRHDELLPVLRDPVVATHDDGTSAHLRPGVVVWPHSTKRHAYEVHTGNFVVELEEKVAAGHVGKSYRAAPAPPAADADAGEFVDRAAFARGEVRLGLKPLAVWYPLSMLVHAKSSLANRTLVTFGSTCADVVAVVPPERIRPKAEIGLTLSRSRQAYAPPRIRAGAALLDGEGRRVGVTTEETGLGTETKAVGGQRCFTRTLVTLWRAGARLPSLPDEVLTLCVSPADLSEGVGAK